MAKKNDSAAETTSARSKAFATKKYTVDGKPKTFTRIKVAGSELEAKELIAAWKARQKKAGNDKWVQNVTFKIKPHESGEKIIYARGRNTDQIRLVKPKGNDAGTAKKNPGKSQEIDKDGIIKYAVDYMMANLESDNIEDFKTLGVKNTERDSDIRYAIGYQDDDGKLINYVFNYLLANVNDQMISNMKEYGVKNEQSLIKIVESLRQKMVKNKASHKTSAEATLLVKPKKDTAAAKEGIPARVAVVRTDSDGPPELAETFGELLGLTGDIENILDAGETVTFDLVTPGQLTGAAIEALKEGTFSTHEYYAEFKDAITDEYQGEISFIDVAAPLDFAVIESEIAKGNVNIWEVKKEGIGNFSEDNGDFDDGTLTDAGERRVKTFENKCKKILPE